MQHPILKNYQSILVYIAIWLVIIIFQFPFLYYSFHSNAYIALVDSSVYTSLFALLGIGIWYPVRYTDFSENKKILAIVNHAVSSVFAIGIWLWLGYSITTELVREPNYMVSATKMMPGAIMYGITLYALIVLIYYLMIKNDQLRDKIINEEELKSLVRESELNLLKSQINPHFLFNSLNSISSLTITNPEKAQEMVIKLSDLMRYSLTQKGNEKASLEKEMENINRYVDIEKIRFGNRLQFESSLTPEALSCQLPYMILQPIFENAVKHGVSSSTEPVCMKFSATFEHGMLNLCLTNNYDTESSPKKGTGTGLKNISDRVRLIYQRSDLVAAKKENGQFEITLSLPQ